MNLDNYQCFLLDFYDRLKKGLSSGWKLKESGNMILLCPPNDHKAVLGLWAADYYPIPHEGKVIHIPNWFWDESF